MQETRHGLGMHRSNWTEDELAGAIETLLTDDIMGAKLADTCDHMQEENGAEKAARLLDELAGEHG